MPGKFTTDGVAVADGVAGFAEQSPKRGRARGRRSDSMVCALVASGDGIALLGSWLAASMQAHAFSHTADLPALGLALILALLLTSTVLYWGGGYRISAALSLQDAIASSFLAWSIVFLIEWAVIRLFVPYDRNLQGWLLLWWPDGYLAFFACRMGLTPLLRLWRLHNGRFETVAILGRGPVAHNLLSGLRAKAEPARRFLGLYADLQGELPLDSDADPVRGTPEDLLEDIRNNLVQRVILAISPEEFGAFAIVLEKLRHLPVDVHLHVATSDSLPSSGGRPSPARSNILTLSKRPLEDWGLLAKAIEDRVIASLALVVILPLMALISVAIKLDSPGPIFFRQMRQGYNGRLIEVLKFRTMFQKASDPTAETLVARGDPRVTRVGKFLRRSSLDELPQFLNVLRGEMSVVGPRPHALSAKAAGLLYRDIVPHYESRHRIKPGITGLAQVSGYRGETITKDQIENRVRFDIEYIENWSIYLDIKILAMTIACVISSKDTY